MNRMAIYVVLALFLGLIAFRFTTFALMETEQAVVLEFGKPVGEPKTKAGLYFRTPFIQEVRRYDKRVLPWDGDAHEYKTRDKKLISIDIFARWRISNALTFLKVVNSESSAQSRLDDFIGAAAREVVARNDLDEVVRDTNRPESDDVPEEEAWKPEDVRLGRSEIARQILAKVKPQAPKLGIDIIDVNIKRVNYTEAVRQAVYQRMIAERERIAEKFRSEGRGIAADWEGRRGRDLQKISSEAFKKAQEERAAAESEAARIYAEAFGNDGEFYAYWRSLQVYQDIVTADSTLVLPLDSSLFGYLNGPEKKRR